MSLALSSLIVRRECESAADAGDFLLVRKGGDEARLLSDLALRSKAYWGYSPEFIEQCREELSYSEEQLRAERMRSVTRSQRARLVN